MAKRSKKFDTVLGLAKQGQKLFDDVTKDELDAEFPEFSSVVEEEPKKAPALKDVDIAAKAAEAKKADAFQDTLRKKKTEPVVVKWESGLPASLAFSVESYALNVGKDEALKLAARLLKIGSVNDVAQAFNENGDKRSYLDDYNNSRTDADKVDISDVKRKSKALV